MGVPRLDRQRMVAQKYNQEQKRQVILDDHVPRERKRDPKPRIHSVGKLLDAVPGARASVDPGCKCMRIEADSLT